ncbi:hypothetical protein NP233_g7389 [Leucocoprinus birnbaumii]|uniref:CxC2-like cysteine cluster KDZ transposase-associated domain-containing protein n=1 Tax=Leucocoprinus birnbaumii TaxID=56174 RepID=A0AAD5VQA6_9AGAR|nr:hypothetical protein NP233_g7389 [Leucocoprinus birnbaumii]
MIAALFQRNTRTIRDEQGRYESSRIWIYLSRHNVLALLRTIENLSKDGPTIFCFLSIFLLIPTSKPTAMKRSRTQDAIHFDDDDGSESDELSPDDDVHNNEHDSYRLLFPNTNDPPAPQKPEVYEADEESEDDDDSLADSDSEMEYPRNPARKQARHVRENEGIRGLFALNARHNSPPFIDARTVFSQAFSIWQDNHFSRVSLNDLGLIIHLGHGGVKCRVSTVLKDMVVVHSNGIHRRRVQYCYCTRLHPYEQLMAAKLFPASVADPSTAFSFEVLEDFHRHSLSSKTAAYDYCKALQEHTNAAFPTTVDNRYREFNTVMRIWRTLTALRRSGCEHKMSSQIQDRRDDLMALVCPACPEVGFNLDAETLENALLLETHKYTFYIMLDGNFRLQQKRKNTDLEDFALNKGHSYFVEEQAFREYLDKIGDTHDNNSTCAKLKAVRQQELIKFKNMIISRVIAVQCARHGLYLPQGMVDLKKGESYSRADYALAHALGWESRKLQWIMLSYDIWCQYSKNLVSRMQNDSWPWMKEVASRIRGAIPKMHIHGHSEQCQLNCSFMYTPFSGMTCGEGIESAWAEQNHAAGSTREQSGGHRHDTLDDFNNYWNWCKIQGLASYLLQQFKKYSKEYTELQHHIKGFEQCISPDLIQEWETMESSPLNNDDSLKSRNDILYRAKNIKLPTQESQSENLISKARSLNVAIDITSKLVHFIEEGITIEKQQSSLQRTKKGMEPEALEDARCRLRKSIDIWRVLQRELSPSVLPFIVINIRPEKEQLHLPSSFNEEQRQALEMGKIAEIEYEIRLGQAYDAIDSLRTAVYLYNSAMIKKRKHVRGTRYNTRANTILNQLSDDKYGCAQVYRLAYRALVSLGLSEDSLLQPLHRDQLWGRDMTRVQGPGESSTPEPWWWMVGKPADTCQEAWHIECQVIFFGNDTHQLTLSILVDRVRWFRMRAALHRLREELEILNEEFKRTIRSFGNYCRIWKRIGDLAIVKGPGYVAYGYRQAEMYKNLAASVQSAYSDVLKHTPTGVSLDS